MNRASTYDTDILEWSEQQAAALRALPKRRRDLSNELDWENLAEEIEDVGRSEFLAVQSFVRQILIPLIKAISSADAASMPHWGSEIVAFHQELLDRITPSMRSRLDLSKIWGQAIKQAEADLAVHDEHVMPALRGGCLVELDEILNPDFDFDSAVRAARRRIETPHAV